MKSVFLNLKGAYKHEWLFIDLRFTCPNGDEGEENRYAISYGINPSAHRQDPLSYKFLSGQPVASEDLEAIRVSKSSTQTAPYIIHEPIMPIPVQTSNYVFALHSVGVSKLNKVRITDVWMDSYPAPDNLTIVAAQEFAEQLLARISDDQYSRPFCGLALELKSRLIDSPVFYD